MCFFLTEGGNWRFIDVIYLKIDGDNDLFSFLVVLGVDDVDVVFFGGFKIRFSSEHQLVGFDVVIELIAVVSSNRHAIENTRRVNDLYGGDFYILAVFIHDRDVLLNLGLKHTNDFDFLSGRVFHGGFSSHGSGFFSNFIGGTFVIGFGFDFNFNVSGKIIRH